MKRRSLLLGSVALACARDTGRSAASSASPTREAPQRSDQPAAEPRPVAAGGRVVLVELFTSQGCSSCPPADAVLSRVLRDPTLPLAAIAFHVDYWNYLGWRDRFSSSRWSQRQREYAEVIPGGRVYTPQFLFDGRDHAVRRDEDRVRAAIERAATRAPSVSLDVSARVRGRDEVEVDLTSSGAPAKVFVALTRSGQVTDVRRGENAGRTLHYDAVATDLVAVGAVGEAVRGLPLHGRTGDGSQHAVVAFASSPEDRRVLGAARVELTA